MSEDFGRHIKTVSQPWWLILPLLIIVLAMAPGFLQKKHETEQLLTGAALPVSITPHLIEPYLQNRLAEESQQALEQANQRLQELIETWAGENDGEFAVVATELGGLSRSAQLNAGQQFVSASTYKLFLVYAVLHEVETGNISLQTVTSLNRTVLDCIDSLLVDSWDVCAYPMGQLLGWDELSEFLTAQGFKDTDINNYDASGNFDGDKYTTAGDEALFMEKLYRGQLLNREHSQLMINKLKNQKWRERIPAGVPEDIEVADKPGWHYEYENDAAIVYGEDSTYVLVVLSNNSKPSKIAELSSLIYKEMNRVRQ